MKRNEFKYDSKRWREYYRGVYYHGHLRFLLLNWKKESCYCDRCGNFANGIFKVKVWYGELKIPYCSKHFIELCPDVKAFPVVRDLEFK